MTSLIPSSLKTFIGIAQRASEYPFQNRHRDEKLQQKVYIFAYLRGKPSKGWNRPCMQTTGKSLKVPNTRFPLWPRTGKEFDQYPMRRHSPKSGAFTCRAWKLRNLFVSNLLGISNRVGNMAKTGAADNGHLRLDADSLFDPLGNGIDLLKSVIPLYRVWTINKYRSKSKLEKFAALTSWRWRLGI